MQQQQQQGVPRKSKQSQRKGKNSAQSVNLSVGKEKESAKSKDSYLNLVCHNCGTPGHNKSMCPQAPFCFICGDNRHKEDGCPEKSKPIPTATLLGSADPGLEFYHIDCEENNHSFVSSIQNIGVVYIEASEISKEELAHEFSIIYKTN